MENPFFKFYFKKLLTMKQKIDIMIWQVDSHTCNGEVLKW